MDGILNIYKEKGFTSHDVVAVVRKTLGIKKVGHTGTLDPQAEGVLPVCVGRATKLSDYIMAEKKGYRALLRLGKTTTTEDAAGEVISQREVIFEEERIKKALSLFQGTITQVPPMYSAIKINGKKLYELAREGKEVARKERQITIYESNVRQFLPPDGVEIEVVCSKGTYIRTLCADIGEALGCGGYMESLLRTFTGNFTLENSISLDTLKQKKEQNAIEDVLLSMEKALEGYPVVSVLKKGEKFLYNGGRVYQYFWESPFTDCKIGTLVRVRDIEGSLVGLHQICMDKEKELFYIKPVTMLL